MPHAVARILLLPLLLLMLQAPQSARAASVPVIHSMNPTSGAPGTMVTVSGTGLTGITQAWIGAGHDAPITNINSTSVQIKVPADASTGLMALGNGTNWAFSPAPFTVTGGGGGGGSQIQPVISSFTPTAGPAGTVITVSGTGLVTLTAAWLGAGHDAVIQSANGTSAQIVVPSDASTGQIALQSGANWSFSHWAFSPASFTVLNSGGQGASSSSSSSSGGSSSSGSGSGSGSGSSSGSSSGSTSSSSSGSSSGSGSGSGSGSSSGGPNPKLAVKVQGNHLIDAAGNLLQLRGVNTSGLEFVAIQGWDPADPWGGVDPNWAGITSWHANVVRIPLNEASWLGYQCTDYNGVTRNPDPGANYHSAVANAVAGATAAGLYVILDLHWASPAKFCPLTQNDMADADNSVAFWTSVASQFKQYPNVIFELYNEPFFYQLAATGQNEWQAMQSGGAFSAYLNGGPSFTSNYAWNSAGYQQMLNAVRGTGATNVVLVGTDGWSGDLSQWLAYRPTDPLGQMGAVWHAYPGCNGNCKITYNGNTSTVANDPNELIPNGGAGQWTYAANILAAGLPIVITETGDYNANGAVGAPFDQELLPWADARNVSYLGWAWDPWQNIYFVLIKSETGTPTDGYGVYFQQHLACRASGATNCP